MKKLLSMLTVLCLVCGLFATCGAVETVHAEEMTLIEPGYYDEHVIPDKYNTGCDESALTGAIPATNTFHGEIYVRADSDEQWYIDFNKNEKGPENLSLKI